MACLSKFDACGACSLRVKANSVLCVQCGKWNHGRCARVKRVFVMFLRNLNCRKCEENIGEAVEQEKSYAKKRKQKGNLHILVTG